MPEPAAPIPGPDEAVRLARRRFFRAFAGDAMSAAAAIVGVAGALRQTTAEAAGALLSGSGLEATVTGAAAPPGPAVPSTPPVEPPVEVYRSPFRIEGVHLVLLDQRGLPDRLVDVDCVTGADVAQAMRDRAVVGAPALGQVAAIGLALTAGRATTSRPWARRAIIQGTANALRNARPETASVPWAVERLLARFASLGELNPDGDLVAAALREEAEAIVAEATLDHARLVGLGLATLPESGERPLQILTLGSTGALAAGQVGTALGVVSAAVAAGRTVHVHVLETRPGFEGARLAAWELGRAGIPVTVVADAAAGWLLADGKVDIVLVGAERIVANGDVANTIGTYPLAVLAARHGVPVQVVAPTASIDLAVAEGSAIAADMRAPVELTSVAGTRMVPDGTQALNPACDVTPAVLVAAIITEEGCLRPPYGPALAAAVAAAEARHPRPEPYREPAAVPVEPAGAEPAAADHPQAQSASVDIAGAEHATVEPATAGRHADPAAADPSADEAGGERPAGADAG